MARLTDDRITGHLPLTPAVFDILLALADGDRHGYAIAREVESRSGGRVRFGPGTLYGTLTRMLGAGLVRECDGPDEDDGPGVDRRRYYRLTTLGREVARAEARRLAELVNVAHAKSLLKGSAWSR
jgi:DNA-binding PadR family transcriptional regulator